MSSHFFTHLRSRLRRIIHATYRPYQRSRFDTSDIVQESMIQIFRDMQKSIPENLANDDTQPSKDAVEQHGETDSESTEARPSLAWLRAVIRGTVGNQIRFHNAQKRNQRLEVRLQDTHPEQFSNNQLSPEEESMLREMKAKLLCELQQLPELNRTVIRLRFFEGKTLEEIAQQLEVSVYAVRSTLQNSLQRLVNKCAYDHDLS